MHAAVILFSLWSAPIVVSRRIVTARLEKFKRHKTLPKSEKEIVIQCNVFEIEKTNFRE